MRNQLCAAFAAFTVLTAGAAAQLTPLVDYYQVFGYGLTLGTNAWTNSIGTLRRDPAGFRPQVSDGTNWHAVGDLSDAPFDSVTYGRKDGFWVAVPTNDTAALAAVSAVSGRVDTVEGWGDHSEAGYLTAETDTAALSAVAAVSGRVDTVESWGDHAEAGYLTAESDTAALAAIAAVSGRVDVVESWGDHAEAGYLTAETDAAALAAVAAVSGRVDTVEGWGDHAEAGYALSSALLGYLPSAQAATQYLSVAAAASAYQPLGAYGTNSTTAYRGDWGAGVSNIAASAYSLAYGIATTNEPLWTAASNRVLYVGDVADVAYGTATDEAYRGDWGAAVSNAAVLRSIRTVPAVAAYAEAGASDLPWLATNGTALILSGLTSGSIGIRVETTNDTGIALYSVAVKDSGGEVLATIRPACDGTRQSASWPWNASETLTIEATGIASPVEGAESAIITAAQVETWADVSLVGKTNDLADQHLYVDYPAATNEAANRAYADDAADAALALALGEIATATFNRDLAGYVQRWNPRFDTVADSNSLSTLYGGSTALRLDGEGAAVVPEIRAFAVESGEVATLTVWSYSGGATNLVPEVTTNLITGTWEKKPESIVSATNIDAFTAQVVFTNDFERLLYVRLVDVSGGSGVPVFRVFGGIAFGDGEAITDWPQGTILGATINEPHAVATNDGILAFTIGATGSGFPLTDDVSAAGFAIEGMDEVVANSLYTTNDASVRDLTVRRNVQVLGNAEYAGDFVVSGNLTLIGAATNLNWITVDNRTNVYGGTNYYETSVYQTNTTYLTYVVHTNVVTTNNVYTYVNNNGMWNATNAEYAWFPHLRDYRDGNAEAIGTWDFADATVSNLYLPPDAIQTASIAALADGVATIDLGSNWCWRLDASGDITAINFSTAGLKEGAMNANSVKGILLEVSRGSSGAWAWGGHLSHITNTAPPADAVSHLLLIGPSQDVTGTNGWAVY